MRFPWRVPWDRFVCGLRTPKPLFQDFYKSYGAGTKRLDSSKACTNEICQCTKWHPRRKGRLAIAVGWLFTKLIIVISRRPPVTAVGKRDISKEPVRVVNNLNEEEGTYFQRHSGWTRIRAMTTDGSVCVHMVGTKPIHVDEQISGKPLSMEVDTGADASLISYKKLKQVLPKIRTTVVLGTEHRSVRNTGYMVSRRRNLPCMSRDRRVHVSWGESG